MNVAITIKLLLLTLIWVVSVIKHTNQETESIRLGSFWRIFSEFLLPPLAQTDLYFGIILINNHQISVAETWQGIVLIIS